ncbi:unnamed protein product [Adineta steineri]|uniref:Pentapeptide repeat-containing protein n=4 Tax=Adineta steineri TaxID=433720 RepID=A0A819RIF6_9BILA|nr:unnamed protein product [Adineta steineri]
MPTVSTMTEKIKGNTLKGFWGGCRSLLVPLMIAVFTITTTVLQMNATRQINEQNLQIAIDNRDIANYSRIQQLAIEESRCKLEREIEEQRRETDRQIAQHNREQDLHVANETRLHQIAIEDARLEQERRIEDQRREADFSAIENRQMDSILATYLKEMSEFLLMDNFTLENRRWAIVVRAKTLTILRQLDAKRKSHTIQFLYEAELLTNKNYPIDLTNADLNNIDMSDRKLNNISLSGALLHNAKFVETALNNSNFNSAKLINSTFEKAKLNNATFYNCDASSSNFNGAMLHGAIFEYGRLIKTTWRDVDGHKIIFNKARIDDSDFYKANLDYTSFYWTLLRGVSFNQTQLNFVDWKNATVLGADFFKADLRQSNITLKQLRQTYSYDQAKLPNNAPTINKTNLLSYGDAEQATNKMKCSMREWDSDKTIVTRTYAPDKVATSLGSCFFTGVEGVIKAAMRQIITINPTNFKNDSRIWIYGRCREFVPADEFKVQFQVLQLDKNNHILTNHTFNLNSQDEQEHDEKSVLYNLLTTQIGFEVTFRRQLQAPINQSLGYCDNLRLFIYDSNYS